MSQSIREMFPAGVSPPAETDGKDEQNKLVIERYLALLEANKKACRAAVTDAGLALDMAGFVQRRLYPPAREARLSPALLALALVQRVPDAPEQ